MSSILLSRLYQRSFEKHPSATVALAGGSLNAVGDVCAQVLQSFLRKEHEPRVAYDPARTFRFFTFGFLFSPVVGRWLLFLERRFPLKLEARKGRADLRTLTKRVASDQIIMAPIGLATLIGTMGVLEGRDRSHIAEKFRDMYRPALITNWQIWPAAQFINFRYMPLPYRIPFQQTVGIFWTLYMSILNAREGEKQAEADAMQRTVHQ